MSRAILRSAKRLHILVPQLRLPTPVSPAVADGAIPSTKDLACTRSAMTAAIPGSRRHVLRAEKNRNSYSGVYSRRRAESGSALSLLRAQSARKRSGLELLSDFLQPRIGSNRIAVDRILKSLDHGFEVRDACLQGGHAIVHPS
jgi:hypothetical protein